MRYRPLVSSIACALLVSAPGSAAPGTAAPGPAQVARRVRLEQVAISPALPQDLKRPEGRSRWNLSAVARQGTSVRTIEVEGASATVIDEPSAAGAVVYSDPAGGDAALRWLLPDRFGESLRPGARQRLEVTEVRDVTVAGTAGSAGSAPAAGTPGGDAASGRRADRLLIEIEVSGIGWVDLPSGPREVVLQRALVLREPDGSRGFVPERLVHRWVDPRAGVVAEVSGPPSADGRGRTAVTDAFVLDAVLAGAAGLTIHLGELYSPPFSDIFYGRDRGAGTAVSSLTTATGVTTIGDLIALGAWDFSPDTSGSEIASTTTFVSSQETCNSAQCGYTVSGGQLERSDKNFDNATSLDKTNDVVEREDRASDTTIWLRAGAEHEGKQGSFTGQGESRFCYTGQFFDTSKNLTRDRTPVPLWVFPHQDPTTGELYFQPGDSWAGGPFACEQNLFNEVCGVGSLFPTLWAQACGTHTGKQFTDVLKGGVVTLPSGHTFNALLVRNVADFCVYGVAGCSSLFKLQEVRTVNYLWQVPHLGTVVRLQSDVSVSDLTSFATVAETDIEFALFPPRGITATGSTDTSVSLAWDPGLDTHRISGYKVYWDTRSGAAGPYGFDSQRNPAQASVTGTSATISGLQPGTTYSITVTSLSTFTDPSTLVSRTYESLLYPTQVSGDPSFVYPVEVQVGTTGGTCIPTAEVTGLTVSHAAGPAGTIQICWNPVFDPCLAGYEVLGADAPQAASNFSVVADTGLETCWTGAPASTDFLVVARGTGGNGPWGHYGL